MPRNFIISGLYVLGALTFVACGDPAAFESPSDETPADGEEASRVLTAFDIAEDKTRFVFDEEPADQQGLPGHGSSFVTQGYMYPFGFLLGREGTDENGAPAFPEHVIGEWTCWGNFIGDGLESESGAWAVSTHLYHFYETPGYAEDKEPTRHTIISEGHELVEAHRIVTRSITGASGLAKGAGGDVVQMIEDTNASGGVNLRLVIHDGFEPLIAFEDLPESPERDREPCEWDLFNGGGCTLF